MYFPDLTSYAYLPEAGEPIVDTAPPVLNIGWLDHVHSYSQGDPPIDFTTQLWVFCGSPVNNTRGFHECPFCNNDPSTYLVVHKGDEQIGMGAGEIWVFGKNGRAYAAPTLIYHYIVYHHYMPPEEFIQAVLESPLPGSLEYDGYAGQYMWGKVMLREKKFRRSQE